MMRFVTLFVVCGMLVFQIDLHAQVVSRESMQSLVVPCDSTRSLAACQINPANFSYRGPCYPPPFQFKYCLSSGSTLDSLGLAGGATVFFSDISYPDSVYWAPFNDAVYLSMAGNPTNPAELLQFSPILSKLDSGRAVWTGQSSYFPKNGGNAIPVSTSFTLTVTGISPPGNPIPFVNSVTAGFQESVGGMVNAKLSPSFKVNSLFTVNGIPAFTFFNDSADAVNHPRLIASLNAGFYYRSVFAEVRLRKFLDADGDIATTGDRSPHPWRFSLYKDSVASQTLIDESNTTEFVVPNLEPGKYIVTEADSGTSWIRINGNTTLFDTLFLASSSVIIDTFINYNANPTSVADGINHRPLNFHLAQNYPNPFNPSTKIRFQLSLEAFVELNVYDMLGREVLQVMNGDLQAGMHEVLLDAARLSSGVYYYRILATPLTERSIPFIQTKKLILTK